MSFLNSKTLTSVAEYIFLISHASKEGSETPPPILPKFTEWYNLCLKWNCLKHRICQSPKCDNCIIGMRPSCSSRNVRCMYVRNEAAPAYVTPLYVKNVTVMLRYELSDCVAAVCTEKESNTRSVRFNEALQRRFIQNWQFVVDSASIYWSQKGKWIKWCCKHPTAATEPYEPHMETRGTWDNL